MRTLNIGIIIVLFSILSGPSFAEKKLDLEIHNPWSPSAPPVVPVRAGYLSFHNNENKTVSIIEIKSPLFERVEIHQTTMRDGVMSMGSIEQLSIPAKQSITLEQGGLHLMLMNPTQKLIASEDIPVEFVLDNGQGIKIELKVEKNSLATEQHEKHQHH